MAESHKPITSIGEARQSPGCTLTTDPNTADMLDYLIRIVTTCREQLAVVNDGLERYEHTKPL